MGPEWVAQQKKLVSTSTTNCGDRNASPMDMADCAPVSDAAPPATSAGGRRTRSAAGIMRSAAIAAMISSVVLQLMVDTSHAAKGAMVMGAMPMPADTSDTARLRCVSNQPVTQAIIGTMMAAALAPTSSPKMS